MPSQEPVTVYISRRIKPGSEAAVAQWQKDIKAACSKFEGFIGSRVLEPHMESGDNIYSVVVRFDSYGHLTHWEKSSEREALYERLQPLILSEDKSKLSGYEPWFPAPGGPKPPTKWKMAIMSFFAVYPIVLFNRYLVFPLVHDLPIPVAILITCIPTSIFMSFLAMPMLSKWFRGWLYPTEE